MTSQSHGVRMKWCEGEAISQVCARSKWRVTFVQRRNAIQKFVRGKMN
jgi:hypothetical protein